jgi:hypothetical protein
MSFQYIWVSGPKLQERLMDTQIIAIQKGKFKKTVSAYISCFIASVRKVVETTGSLISQLLPKHIHAVTAREFELKVGLFVLASSINFLW